MPGTLAAISIATLAVGAIAAAAPPQPLSVVLVRRAFRRLAREMAKRALAEILEIKSSHAAMLSHPKDLAAFIETAGASPPPQN